MPELRRYEGRTVLVTGGGSGIGAQAGERVAADLRASGAEALAVEVDVSDPTAVEAAVDRVVDTLGPLRFAFNNAGFGGARLAPEDMPLEQWDRTLAVNLSGVFYCMRAERPHLAAAGGGAIVNTASVLSVVASGTGVAYTATKHGVLAITRSCALAWGEQGIRVNAVGPGFTPTPFVAAATEAYRAAALAQMPLGRFPQPEDIAATVAFLGSDEARAITGGLYMVDSGFTIS